MLCRSRLTFAPKRLEPRKLHNYLLPFLHMHQSPDVFLELQSSRALNTDIWTLAGLFKPVSLLINRLCDVGLRWRVNRTAHIFLHSLLVSVHHALPPIQAAPSPQPHRVFPALPPTSRCVRHVRKEKCEKYPDVILPKLFEVVWKLLNLRYWNFTVTFGKL